MPKEAGKFITDPQEWDRLVSSLVQMLTEGKSEAELVRWAQINIPDEIQRELISITAGTIAIERVLPQLRDSVEQIQIGQVLDEIERWQQEAQQRLDEINANLGEG